MRLKSRNLSIPNGFFYRQVEIKWDSRTKLPMHPSFDTLVRAVISARQANPHHTAKHKWATDYDGVASDVDSFNAMVAMSMPGGNRFVAEPGGGAPPPFYSPPSPEKQRGLLAAAVKAKKLWAGIRTLSEWYDSKAPAVPPELAEKRAKVCTECPKNEPGDLSKWFTNVAEETIKRQVAKFSERNLKTSYDDKLFTCTGCLCINALSVHAPIEIKIKNMSEEVEAELRTAPNCWVISEKDGK